jgi:CHAD domain-containing protein
LVVIEHVMTPIDVFQREIAAIRAHYNGVLDGECGSIHDARIATRRTREVLPLTHQWQRRDHADQLYTIVKRMGRSLGRVRDVDVRIPLLRYMEARIPHAAPSIVLVRQRDEHQRLLLMRKLVKRFERLGVHRELATLAALAPWRRPAMWAARIGPWREQLRRNIDARATAAADAVTRATGVYFPRRLHAARIEIKKLRYATEIAVDTGVIGDVDSLRTLKKSQDLLGDLHDRQALVDELRDAAAGDSRIDPAHIALVEQFATADIADRHARFLERRAQLHDAAEAIRAELRRPKTAVRAAAVAGAIAVITGLEARRRWRAGQRSEPLDAEIAVRVPIVLDHRIGR